MSTGAIPLPASPAERRLLLLTLAWPAIIEMSLHMLVWVIDTAMVARLGAEALSAVSLGAQINWTVIWVCMLALSMGTQVLVSQATGRGDRDACRAIAGAGVGGAAALGILLTFGLRALAPHVFRLAAMGQAVTIPGTGYMRLVALAACFTVPAMVATGAIRGSGDTRTPLYIALIMNAINVVLDYGLIFGRLGLPQLGVQGAALATFIAQAVGAALTFAALLTRQSLRPAWDDLAASRQRFKDIIRLGLPSSGEALLCDGARVATAFIIASLGATAFAANQVTIAAESMSFLPGHGLAMATSVLVGQRVGGGHFHHGVEDGKEGARLSLVAMGAIALVFLAVPAALLRLFTGQEAVVLLAVPCLRVAALTQPGIAITEAFNGALRGAGDTRTPMRITALGAWVLRVPLFYLVIRVLGLGLPWAWAVIAMEWTVRAVITPRAFLRRDWAAEAGGVSH